MKLIIQLLLVYLTFAIECNSTQYIKNDVCVECDINCATTCEDNYGCRTCTTGYYVNNGTCKQCDKNCEECTNDEGCISCKHGYHVDNMICDANILNDFDYFMIIIGSIMTVAIVICLFIMFVEWIKKVVKNHKINEEYHQIN